MTIYEGETVTPVLTLTDGGVGADTAVTVTVTGPDGVAGAPIGCVASDGGQTHTAAATVTFGQPGQWVYAWSITGTGAGSSYDTVAVAPAPMTSPADGRVYADSADYARWISAAPPAGVGRALWVASRRVDELLTTAMYDTDDDGYPVDAGHRQAMRWAACAQADYMRAIGDPYGRGALGTLSSVSIGSVSVGRAVTASGTTAPPRYSHDAREFLFQAGLLNQGPVTGW
nr:hypothetical protein [Salinispora vitiensis]